jgi:LacI family transcriptional regulator
MPDIKRLAVYDLARKRTPTIGVLVHQLGNPFLPETLRGIQKVTGEWGCEVLFSNAWLLFDRGVDGVLAIDNGIPSVFFGRADRMSVSGSVMIDDAGCGYLAAEHLIRQGCRRLVLVTSSRMRDSGVRQYMGFQQALKRWDAGISGNLMIAEDMGVEGGAAIAERILRMETLPHGLFIADDSAAVACLRHLTEAGVRVPEDVAIVGFNNAPAGRLITPALTTIDYPGFEIGRLAASALLGQLAGRSAAVPRIKTIVSPALIIRKSSLRNKLQDDNSTYSPPQYPGVDRMGIAGHCTG